MKIFKTIIDFYINSSIHVGLSCYALVRITQMRFHISHDESMANFALFGTIVGYNFVKYDALARTKKLEMRNQLKTIALFSFCSLLLASYYFFCLQKTTRLFSILVLGLTLLYTLPFFPNKKNVRNWAGVKIYIVALCWVGVTVILPVLNANTTIETDFFSTAIQRFIVIFVLILIFEIIDLKQDDPNLQTVPQQIGIQRTKQLGYFLLLIFCGLEFSNNSFNNKNHYLSIALIGTIGLLLAFANEKKSKYYTSFWTESIPILWWLLLLLFNVLV